MCREYLRVKAESLEAESRIIRNHENDRLEKAVIARYLGKDPTYHEKIYRGLNSHRRNELRKEARSTNIAYGFLKGKTYREIETLAYVQPDWERVKTLAGKYSEDDTETFNAKWAQWISAALDNMMTKVPSWIVPGTVKQYTCWCGYSKEYVSVMHQKQNEINEERRKQRALKEEEDEKDEKEIQEFFQRLRDLDPEVSLEESEDLSCIDWPLPEKKGC
jgi:hypothetical protein